MYSSFVKFLDNPGSLKVDVPIAFVKQVYGESWEHKKLQIIHISGKIGCKSETMLPITSHQLACIKYVKRVLFGAWTYLSFIQAMFSQGWPEVCNGLGIQDDDLLTFRRLDDVVFDLTVHRNATEIRLTKRAESDEYAVFQISKAEYFEKVFKKSSSLPAETVKSRKPRKVDVQNTPRKRNASHLKTMEDDKGKGKLIVDGNDIVSNIKKGFQGPLRIKTYDAIVCCGSPHKVKGKKFVKVVQNVKHTNKITINASKHSGDGKDAEFFNFRHKGDYRLRLPVEVVKQAGLSDNLHPLSVQNRTGVVEIYELNGVNLRYAIDGWWKFMSDNKLKFGHVLYFTYVTSQKKIVTT